MADRFHFFWGGPFSQFAKAPFELDGQRFATAEHYMMWRKAQLFGDADAAAKILAAKTPGEAKGLGRKVRRFNHQVWDREKRGIVRAGSLGKYQQNAMFKGRLLATAPALLVEASPMDTIWGIGLAADDPRAEDPSQWLGENLLGQILTETREILAAEDAAAPETEGPSGRRARDRRRR